MDSSSSEIAEQFVQLFEQNCAGASVLALVFFEYIITLPQEINNVWRRKLTWTSILLVSIRWVMVLTQVVAWFPVNQQTCGPYSLTLAVLNNMAYAQVALFSALRVSILWTHTRYAVPLFVVVFLLGIVPIASNVVLYLHWTTFYTGAPFYICTTVGNVRKEVGLVGAISFSWTFRRLYSLELAILLQCGCPIAADVIVLAFTVKKTFHVLRDFRQANMTRPSVTECLMRDGTLYFLAMFSLNVAQMATSAAPGDILLIFLQPMPALLVSRFMLNLRQISADDTVTPDSSGVSSFKAASALAFRDMAQPLRHGQMDSYLDDGEEFHAEERWDVRTRRAHEYPGGPDSDSAEDIPLEDIEEVPRAV